MIIWINGTFGVGKTETAKALGQMLDGAYIYDPELVGQFLWYTFPETMKREGDFQDIPLWRSMNYDLIHYLYQQYPGDLIIPMTIANPEYADEIIGRLQRDGLQVYHFLLIAGEAIIHKRLVGRGEPEHSWAEFQMPRCLAGFQRQTGMIEIKTEDRTVQQVAEQIIQHIKEVQPNA